MEVKKKKKKEKRGRRKKKHSGGLSCVDSATAKRIAMMGGLAAHRSRGLQTADEEVRKKVAQLGGLTRALDRAGLSLAGSKGGNAVKELYGIEHYIKIGSKGGGSNRKISYGFFIEEEDPDKKKKKQKQKQKQNRIP
jgi:hypothetical protein